MAYFSRPGENYYYGKRRDLNVGNTEVLAGMIADRITCDVHRIEAAAPYSDSYDDTVARNIPEQEDDARPGIANSLRTIARFPRSRSRLDSAWPKPLLTPVMSHVREVMRGLPRRSRARCRRPRAGR
ncbi:hypothetical protein [Streptomyces sp. NBC_00498]|uniref:hypothetical protein n=1 Tax=Streptomyces sp. NBC_00498 TaxID=2975760 RepID=UPI002E1821E2